MVRARAFSSDTAARLRLAIQNNGYVRLQAAELCASAQLLSMLQPTFKQLGRDRYYRDGDRRRALSKLDVRVRQEDYEIEVVAQSDDYYQSLEYNPTIGGILRRYEPVPSTALSSPVLLDFVVSHLELFPETAPGAVYRVHVHLIRMAATPGLSCDTSPPGLHKDGEKYIAVYLVDRRDVTGAENLIANNHKTIRDRFVLTNPGEGYVIDDDVVWHALTPVSVEDDRNYGFRDVLLIDFCPAATLLDDNVTPREKGIRESDAPASGIRSTRGHLRAP